MSDISSQQNCNVSNKIDLSTGLRQNNTQINIGEVDNYWKLVIIPPLQNGAQQHSSVEIPKLYRVPTLNAYWNVTGAAIVSPKNITNFPENNAFANQPWRIRRYFCIAKKGNYKLEGEYRCDDTGSLSLHKVEGTQLSINNTGSNGFNSSTQINHLLSLDQGTYYVEARILNTKGGHMGFSFKGSLTAQGNDLLSPQDNETCCPVGSINILKIIDKNCNGKYDNGDEIGVNWQFEVFKNNVKVGTITTNTLGEGSIGGLTSGNYIVKELEKNGYYPYQSSYNQNITLLKNDSKQITFFNCIGSPPPYYNPCCPPFNLEELQSMMEVDGDFNTHRIKFIPTIQWRKKMQAYVNWRAAINPCLESFSFNLTIRKPKNGTTDQFDLAEATSVSGIWIAFKAGDLNNTCYIGNGYAQWNNNVHEFNADLPSNRWHRIHTGIWGNPTSCLGWDKDLCQSVGFKYNLFENNQNRTTIDNGKLTKKKMGNFDSTKVVKD